MVDRSTSVFPLSRPTPQAPGKHHLIPLYCMARPRARRLLPGPCRYAVVNAGLCRFDKRCTRLCDAFNVPVVSTTATAQNPDLRIGLEKRAILLPQFLWIAIIQLFGFIKFSMTTPGSVGTQTADTVHPDGVFLKHMIKMLGVGAVDHI